MEKQVNDTPISERAQELEEKVQSLTLENNELKNKLAQLEAEAPQTHTAVEGTPPPTEKEQKLADLKNKLQSSEEIIARLSQEIKVLEEG